MVSRRRAAPLRRRRRRSPQSAVLFDLDDTLFDHQHASRSALSVLRREYASLRRLSPRSVERRYRAVLDRFHLPMLQGSMSLAAARRRRFGALFEEVHERLTGAELERRIRRFRRAYRAAQRPVPGAVELLRQLHYDHRIVVVSNNRQREQLRKIREIGLGPYIDAVVTSQRVGVTKPATGIFVAAIAAARVPAERCLVIGNSWTDDVQGARRAGLRVVWFAPGYRPRRRAGVPVLGSLRPSRTVAGWIRGQAGGGDPAPA